MIPFFFVSEKHEVIDGEKRLIEIWEHKYSKKQFQVDRKHFSYRLFNPKKKKQDPFLNCPFLKYLSLELKINK